MAFYRLVVRNEVEQRSAALTRHSVSPCVPVCFLLSPKRWLGRDLRMQIAKVTVEGQAKTRVAVECTVYYFLYFESFLSLPKSSRALPPVLLSSEVYVHSQDTRVPPGACTLVTGSGNLGENLSWFVFVSRLLSSLNLSFSSLLFVLRVYFLYSFFPSALRRAFFGPFWNSPTNQAGKLPLFLLLQCFLSELSSVSALPAVQKPPRSLTQLLGFPFLLKCTQAVPSSGYTPSFSFSSSTRRRKED